MTPTQWRDEVAVVFTAALDRVPISANVPSTPFSSTGFLRPSRSRPWMDHSAGTFCNPAVAYDLVLIAPPLPALAEAVGWFETRLAELSAAAKKTRSGFKVPAFIEVSSPGLLDAGAGLLAVVIQLAPVVI